MRRWRRGVLSLSLVVGALSGGCAATRPVAPRPAPAVLPSAADLTAALATRRAAVHSLRALARLRYRDPEASSSSREAIVVARPDRVRVEVLSVFGSVFVLTADHGAMTAYAQQEDTVYRGPASLENLQRFGRLGVPVDDLVDIVLGTPPLRHGQPPHVSFDSAAGAIRLWQALDAGAQTVWLSDTGAPLAAEERGTDGQVRWRATFGQYEDHGGKAIATRIGLELPVWHRSMEIALEDIDVNPTLDHSIFAVQAPPGSKVVQLDHLTD
jgi:hypothetical protein